MDGNGDFKRENIENLVLVGNFFRSPKNAWHFTSPNPLW